MTVTVASEFELANQKYAEAFDKSSLPLPPARWILSADEAPPVLLDSKVAVVTCMDARIDPAKALGLVEGDAHVIRNAGGRAADAVRSIVISQQLLGTREIVVVHHTSCGMLTFSDNDIRTKIRQNLTEDADHIAFLPFGDLKQSVVDDVRLLKKNPLILDVPITGYIYDVKTGRINRVEA